MLNNLNTEQLRCVKQTEGPLLILAGPGSGKTKTITTRISYIIEKELAKPEEIVAITFTNKAAREMRERVEQLIGEKAKRVMIATFHSFCVRLLRKYADKLGYRSNFTIMDEDDSKRVLKTIVNEYNITSVQIDIIWSEINASKNSGITAKQYAKNFSHHRAVDDIVLAFEKYNETLKANNAFDFNDLICKVVELLSTNPNVRKEINEKYKYVHVDEYQDTNNAQFELVGLLSNEHYNVAVVGDPDQSIYGWRGANFQNIEKFRQKFKRKLTEVQLIVNYRSTESIIKAAEELISHNKKHKKKKMITVSEKNYHIEYRNLFNEQQEAGYISTMIKQLIQNDTNLRYEDFAILYRNNELSRTIEENLMRSEIPYVIKAGISFYSRREIKDMIAYMNLTIDPSNPFYFKRVINIPKRGIGAKTIEKIENLAIENKKTIFDILLNIEAYSEFSAMQKQKLGTFAKLISEFQENYQKYNNLIKLYDLIITKSNYQEHLVQTEKENAEEKYNNVLEFKSAIINYQEASLEPTLHDFLENQALGNELETVEEDQNRVSLITLHAAKGLEFKVVFIIATEEGILPNFKSIQEQNIDEERRLMYVGITRAKERLFISSVSDRLLYGRRKPYDRSRFIDETYIDRNRGLKENDLNMNIEFQIGEKILHDRFGTGTVVSIDENNNTGAKMTIDFETSGRKTILKNHAAIHKL